MPTQMESDRPRGAYGRVYLYATIPDHKYSARIWDAKGRDIWNTLQPTPEAAFDAMQAAALVMDQPVQLYRHDGSIAATTVGKDLPF